ncbi:hypothetical protein [Andreprevotia chitinilytica]|uniref:hypothetical protein n=1 Tax=Andreprevotia chitinilytica TaxID=396808 RepID=UPI00054EDC07|nr:hypothetical protein [Andreprevotia chitinilytica]
MSKSQHVVFSGGAVEIGSVGKVMLSKSGYWTVVVGDVAYELINDRDYFRALILLEADRPELASVLAELEGSGHAAFPIEKVIASAFLGGADYWAALALDWIDELAFEKKLLLVDHLKQVVDAKWAHQHTRQLATKALRAIQAVGQNNGG